MTRVKAREAVLQVTAAVRRGDLVRPEYCQACDCHRDDSPIYAHHWQGYGKPLDILWVCASCNAYLRGKHDGSMSLEDIREFIASKAVAGRMKSRVKKLSLAAGFGSVTELHYATRLPRAVIKQSWLGYLDSITLRTAVILSRALGCAISDLYEFVVLPDQPQDPAKRPDRQDR